MDPRKILLAVVAAIVLLVGGSVAYATNNAPDPTNTGNQGAQVAGQDDSEGPGDDEESGEDADEPGDYDGPGDTED